MNIRVLLDGHYTVLSVFWAQYDEDAEGVNFFTLDDDVVTVKMSMDVWQDVSSSLMCRGFVDFARYEAVYDNGDGMDDYFM